MTNYLMPPVRKARNPLLPLETTEMTTSPLTERLTKLEKVMTALEQTLEKETVNALATRRIHDRRRWPGASPNDPASSLATSPSDNTASDEADDNEPTGPTHRFEAMVAEVARRDNVPLAEAARRARRQYPTLYADYIASGEGVAKSYDQLVRDEIRKGCSAAVAAAKVAYAHPHAARETMAKRDSGVAEFMTVVDTIMKHDGVSRGVAMGRARRENPAAFGRYQNV
jgi:hypothetical protein